MLEFTSKLLLVEPDELRVHQCEQRIDMDLSSHLSNITGCKQ